MSEVKNVELVSEMKVTSKEPPLDFNISPDFDYKRVLKEDKSDDKFIYAYTVSGISKNKRNWTPDVVRSIGQQVLDKIPNGFLGHIKPEDAGYVLPEPQIVWFGSKEEAMENNGVRMWLKGYILPTAEKAKIWIKNKAIDSISVWGKIAYELKDGITHITEVDLKSIDLSRKLGEGLPAFITDIAGEMDGEEEVSEVKVTTAYEMQKSYNDVIRTVERLVYKKFVKDQGDSERKYYYVEQVYDGYIIVREDSDNTQLYKLEYTVDGDQIILDDTLTPVVKQVKYLESTEAGEQSVEVSYEEVTEMGNKQKWQCDKHKSYAECKKADCTNAKNCTPPTKDDEAGEMATMSAAIAKLTISDIKLNNPSIYEAIKEEVLEEAKLINKKEATAGEMASTLADNKILSSGINKIAHALKMTTFAGESEGAVDAVEVNDVVRVANEIVEAKEAAEATNVEINNLVEPVKTEEQSTVEAVQNLVTAQVVATNQQHIDNVVKKFNELTANIDNEVVLEYVKESFSNIIEVGAEDITEDDWEAKSIEYLESNIEDVITKHVERANKLTETSRLAGEMSAVVNLGNNLPSSSPSKAKTLEDMTPEEAAAKLGY